MEDERYVFTIQINDLIDRLDCHTSLRSMDDETKHLGPDFFLFLRDLIDQEIILLFGKIFDKNPDSISIFSLIKRSAESASKERLLTDAKKLRGEAHPILTLRNKSIAHNDRRFLSEEVDFKSTDLNDLKRIACDLKSIVNALPQPSPEMGQKQAVFGWAYTRNNILVAFLEKLRKLRNS